jgi:hypothetical protein
VVYQRCVGYCVTCSRLHHEGVNGRGGAGQDEHRLFCLMTTTCLRAGRTWPCVQCFKLLGSREVLGLRRQPHSSPSTWRGTLSTSSLSLRRPYHGATHGPARQASSQLTPRCRQEAGPPLPPLSRYPAFQPSQLSTKNCPGQSVPARFSIRVCTVKHQHPRCCFSIQNTEISTAGRPRFK